MMIRFFSPGLLILFAASILLMVDAANAGRISVAGSCDYFEMADSSPIERLDQWVARGNVNLSRASRFNSLALGHYSRVALPLRRPVKAPRVAARPVPTKSFEPNWNFPATTIQRRWSYQHVAARLKPAAASPIAARKLEPQPYETRDVSSSNFALPCTFRMVAESVGDAIGQHRQWMRWLADQAEVLPPTGEAFSEDEPAENYWSYYRDCDHWQVVLTSSLCSDRFAEPTLTEMAPDDIDSIAATPFSITQWFQPVRDWLASIRIAANRWSTELY